MRKNYTCILRQAQPLSSNAQYPSDISANFSNEDQDKINELRIELQELMPEKQNGYKNRFTGIGKAYSKGYDKGFGKGFGKGLKLGNHFDNQNSPDSP